MKRGVNVKARDENPLQAHLRAKGLIMKTQNTFEKKDWGKAAKAFAKQAYGKEKREAIERERRFDTSKVEWDY